MEHTQLIERKKKSSRQIAFDFKKTQKLFLLPFFIKNIINLNETLYNRDDKMYHL